ncbi:hypothetical protein [Actinomadura sp. 6N118]|uniref:hypothetical protein n=1 Tax=Actinomadura sp. 6N118 TaxID=3375151 RepID=UPI003790856D
MTAVERLESAREDLLTGSPPPDWTARRQLASCGPLLTAITDEYTRTDDPAGYAAFLGAWLEACPLTSGALAAVPLPADTVAAEIGPLWENALGLFLETFPPLWPQVKATLPEPDVYARRILDGLRRAWVTLRPAASGEYAVRALRRGDLYKGQELVGLRRCAVNTLYPGHGPAFTLWKDVVREHTLAAPTREQVTRFRERGFTYDDRFVPTAERAAVAAFVVALTALPDQEGPDGRIDLRGTIVPLEIDVSGKRIRYEFVTGHDRRIRVERIGPPAPRPVPATLTGTTAEHLAEAFGLRSVAQRTGSAWTAADVRTVAVILDRARPRLRETFGNLALLRDGQPPGDDPDLLNGGAYHHSAHDVDPAELPDPPHIHLYDPAFDTRDLRFCGAPGDHGGELEFTLGHELGHVMANEPRHRVFAVLNERREAARPGPDALIDDYKAVHSTLGLSAQFRVSQLRNAWMEARSLHTAAYDLYRKTGHAYANALSSSQADLIDATRPHFEQARTQAEKAARAMAECAVALDKFASESNLVLQNPSLSRAAALTKALTLDLYRVLEGYVTLSSRVLDFVALARRVGHPILTSYAATDHGEWYAETWALFLTDPERLWDLCWPMYRWLEDGCRRLDAAELPEAFPA